MSKNKEEPNISSPEQELEKKIDEMLDPAKPDKNIIKPAFEVLRDENTIDEEPKTAPEVSEALDNNIENTEHKDGVIDTDSSTEEITETDDNREITENDQENNDKLQEFASDKETDKAVDEIVAKESDELLAVEDEKIAKAFDDKKPNLWSKIKIFFINWWNNKRARWITIIALLLLLAGALTVPASRYFLLNSVGVRGSASVVVLDDSTQQPLKNVSVAIRGKVSLTDENGKAVIYGLKLGRTELLIEKRAFAEDERKITLGWGSNPLGDFKLTPVGSQYLFIIRDFLSSKPIAKAEAISGEYSAFSDEEGRIRLTVDNSAEESFVATITAKDQREEKITVNFSDKDEREVKMVPWRKHSFVTKRSGKYDLYKIDADGSNEELVLAGTGVERDDIVLVPHSTKEKVALVSTRENARNQDGYLLSTLTVINLEDNEPVKIDQSERIQIIDWIGDSLIYIKITAGSSAANPNRHKLISYNVEAEESKEIASSNYFNDVAVALNRVYYAPSSAYASGSVGLYKTAFDGGEKKALLDKEVWSMIRTGYDKFVISTGESWHELSVSDDHMNKLGGEPSNLKSRVYSDNPSKTKSLWIDQRDGKGSLITYDIEQKNDSEPVHSQSGLKDPIRWLNDKTIVFRISNSIETSDYVINIEGGDPKKIKSVTDTASVDKWYYY